MCLLIKKKKKKKKDIHLLREGNLFLSSLWSKVAIAQQLGSALNYLAFCNLSHGLQAVWCQNPLKHLKKVPAVDFFLFFQKK